MQWKKLTRLKAATGHSRARRMLCCGRRKENGRSVPDVTASPGRAPPGPLPNQMQHMSNQRQQPQAGGGVKEPILQGDFRKVSGISSDVFRQIEAVENDHDPNTAAALEAVERRGEMIVRILEARNIGGKHAVEAAQRLMTKGDGRHTVQLVEIVKRPGQTLGLYIREGNGADRTDGVFISRIALESAVYNSGCLRVGDEILAVNLVDVTHMSLDDVVIIMSIPRRLVLAIRQRRGSRGGASSPGAAQLSRPEQKPPPVVVIKRDLRDEDLDEPDRMPRSRSSRERRTGDGREMTESRSRLGLGLNNYSPQSEQLDLYYNSRPSNVINEPPSWGYKPPPPPPSVITEQPKGHHFAPSHAYYQNAGTLESLAEKVHSFYPGGPSRRMSAGTSATAGVGINQQHARFPRSGSDQHLPRVEYSDYATSLGRHSLLRSSLKTGQPIATAGGTLGRYGRYEPSRTAKYGTPPSGPSSLTRRSRPNLDYSSDTEATIGQPRPSYYYYNRPAITSGVPSRAGGTSVLGGGPDMAKFNSLPRDRPGVRLGGIRPRIGERLLDEADGNLSAPESSLRRERDLLRAKITASPSIFTSDEYRAWLRRAPSSSAICDQMRMSRDLLAQPRSYRFSCSAENIHDALRNTESIYSSRTGVMAGTLDRHMGAAGLAAAQRAGLSALPVRSMSSQHIGTASSIRSPSIRRMRQLLELSTGGPGIVGPNSPSGSIISGGHQSPAPTPSATLPRSHRQIDINPAEFLKYKLDKPVMEVGGVSGMLWIHLLAGRGLRSQPDVPSANPLQQAQQPLSRDLYCVLECDRVHKARTVVRSGDLQFDWDESFELDLVCNKQLDVLVYSWDPQHRHKLCYRGAISLASILRQSSLHQLALKVEPRGTIYIRLRHTDPITLYKRRGLPSLRAGYPQLFGADLDTVVNRESKGAPGSAPVPIVLRRCVEEVERRGLDIIGLYRLCGSATKKRLLREAFERNSRAVELSPEHVPDINVITGVLKDYLRELPEPLFTRCLFQMTVDALAVCLPDDPEGNAKLMLSILDCLPRANRATLVFLLDHLSLVVSASERNKMSAQALATVMGPPLMLHSSNAQPGADIDHAQPIAVLKYLLQIWPQPQSTAAVASGRRGEPTGQRGNKVSASQVDRQLLQQRQLQHIMGMGLHQQAASMALSQGPHHHLATVSIANIPQFQSVVGQSVQLPRVSQQVGQQHLQSEASAGSVTQDQSLLPGTPSPGSSSTSGSGSGSGTDTVKRGASPSSVKHVKIHESSSSLSISNSNSSTATVKLTHYNNQQQQQQQPNEQMQQNDFTNISSSNLYTNSNNKLKDIKDISSNDKSRLTKSNLKDSNNGSTNSYGPSYTKSLSNFLSKDNGSTTINNLASSTSSIPSSSAFSSMSSAVSSSAISASASRTQQKTTATRSRSRNRFEDSDSDTESTRSKTPNPLLEQSQAMTTAQLMSKYLKREPLVSMTLTESPCPPIMSSLSSSIRDICAASKSATSKYDKPSAMPSSLGSTLLEEGNEPTNNLFSSIKNHLSSSNSYIYPSDHSKSAADGNGISGGGGSTITNTIDEFEKKSNSYKQSSSNAATAADTIGRQASPSRFESNDSSKATAATLQSSIVARNISLFQTKQQSSSSTDSSASISSASDSNNYLTNNKNLLIDEKQFNNINNYPVSPDPFNTSFINFDKIGGSSASLSQSTYGCSNGTNGGNGLGTNGSSMLVPGGNGRSGNGHYDIYGTLPKTANSAAMLSSTSSYLSSGGGSSDTTSGVSSMTGSTTSYDYYMNSGRQYSLGNSSLNGSGGNYHTLGSYRVQYTATNPFLDIFEPANGSNGNGNGSKKSSATALNIMRENENDLK